MIPTAHNLKEPGVYWATSERGDRVAVHVFLNHGKWMVEARGAYDWDPADIYFDFDGPFPDPTPEAAQRSLAFEMSFDLLAVDPGCSKAAVGLRWCTNLEEFYGFEPGRVTFVERGRDGANHHVYRFLAHPAPLDPERDGVKRGDFSTLGIGVGDKSLP